MALVLATVVCAAFLTASSRPLAPRCWQIGNEYRFSDDGEPAGTAGLPILAAIEGSGLDGG